MSKERYANWLAETGCLSEHLLSLEPLEDLAQGIATLAYQRGEMIALLSEAIEQVEPDSWTDSVRALLVRVIPR